MLAALLLLATHPSIFFGSSDVTTLRQAAQTTHSEIASHITAVLNQHLNDPTPSPTEYDDYRFLGNQVAVWAFGYQITGNAQYASIARSQLLTYAGWSTWDNGESADLGGPDLNEAHMLNGVAVQTVAGQQYAHSGLCTVVARADLIKLHNCSSSIFEFSQFQISFGQQIEVLWLVRMSLNLLGQLGQIQLSPRLRRKARAVIEVVEKMLVRVRPRRSVFRKRLKNT